MVWGGQDLTPYYLFEEDALVTFTKYVKKLVMNTTKTSTLNTKNVDEYFWNAHRGEARGVGGLFFDYLRPDKKHSAENWYDFVTGVGDSFLEAYVPIVQKRKNFDYSDVQRQWQEVRRGRYVEFNLIHDKGTLFGLKTNGRIESILMSLPPHVQWQYNHKPDPNSRGRTGQRT